MSKKKSESGDDADSTSTTTHKPTDAASPDAGGDLLEAHAGFDVLAAVRRHGAASAAPRKRGKVDRTRLPLDVPFRIRESPLGVARLVKLSKSPYGFVYLPTSIAATLDREAAQYVLYLGATLEAEWFIFAAALEGFTGGVAAAELTAVARAVKLWTVVSSQTRGEREILPCRDFGEPCFPTGTPNELVEQAFDGRLARDVTHPLLSDFLGRFSRSGE